MYSPLTGEGFRFLSPLLAGCTPLRYSIWKSEEGGPNSVSVVYIVAVGVDAPVVVDVRSIVAIVAGRPQPPPITGTPEKPAKAYSLYHAIRLRSLFIQAPRNLRHSVVLMEICSYYFGRIHF